MKPIVYINRKTGQSEIEDVYGGDALRLLYGNSLFTKLFGTPLAHVASRLPAISALYGFLQKLPQSKRKISPFIKRFKVDTTEFEKNVSQFSSFNDFFIRKLKIQSRPIYPGKDVAVMPADGRFLVYPRIDQMHTIKVKGTEFNLTELLQDEKLAEHYHKGSMVLGRLCPSDCHRFFFSCDGIPSETKVINGWLYSVNPFAVNGNWKHFTQNKRTLCKFGSDNFGEVIVMEIGATNVGSIHQTYKPYKYVEKGAEKGYFSFGGSAVLLLFAPGRIKFDDDLVKNSEQGLETLCLIGQKLGIKY